MMRRNNAAPENIWIEGTDRYQQIEIPLTLTQPTYDSNQTMGGVVDLSGQLSGDMFLNDYMLILGYTSDPTFVFSLYSTNPGYTDGQTVSTVPNPILHNSFTGGATSINGHRVRASFKIHRLFTATPNLYFMAVLGTQSNPLPITSLRLRLGLIKRGA